MKQSVDTRSWYREPWPWLLMAGPAIVVVASAITLWLAVSSDDGLVVDDYYKQGRGINQILSRDQAALQRGYRATLAWRVDSGRMRVTLSGHGELPPTLRLLIVHPTRPGLDQVAQLDRIDAGLYEAAAAAPSAGRWLVTIEDDERNWRLTGEWQVPQQMQIQLVAREGGS